LIFVIVILGILAAVAIPKLMATRDDAKIAAMAQQIQSAIQEIPQYVVSQGKVDNLENMSQVLKQLEAQGAATLTDTNTTHTAVIKTETSDGSTENCIQIDVNATTMEIEHLAGSDTICTGIKNRIAEGNFTIRGTGVQF